MNAIQVTGVEKRFGRGRGSVQALGGVSLSVLPGEIYGLLGRNGAGKTTLVKILLDIVRPTAGVAEILGQSCRLSASRQRAGYLPEGHRFPEYHTAESALRMFGHLSGLPKKTIRERIPVLLRRFSLFDARRRKVRTFSKGMKQRLGLAQAMIHEPEVIFLDEPTDGVDPVGRAEIRTSLESLKEEGKTILLNSHLLSEVEQVCDRVGILDNGQLVREGTIDELTRSTNAFHLVTDPPPTDELVTFLAPIVASRLPSGSLEVEVESIERIDEVIDRLRSAKVGIRSLQPKHLTLEQVFLQELGSTAKKENQP